MTQDRFPSARVGYTPDWHPDDRRPSRRAATDGPEP